MDLGLAGRVALVTGASSGIGAATARLLAKEGADVLVAYGSSESGASHTASTVMELGRRAWTVQMEVADPTSVGEAVAHIPQAAPELDAVVLCAGLNVVTPFAEVSAEEWDAVVRVNLSGTFYVL